MEVTTEKRRHTGASPNAGMPRALNFVMPMAAFPGAVLTWGGNP